MIAWLRARRHALPLIVAVLLFLGLGGWYSEVSGTWHEEVSVYPNGGYAILREPVHGDAPGSLPLEPGCGAEDAPRFVVSRERPLLSLCLGGRGYPLMVASYFTGYLYWPASLLRFVHDDDVFALRKLGLLIGAVGLFATYRLLRRLADAQLAGAAVVIAAASSPFVYGHALLVHYELLPWVFLVFAMLFLVRCEVLAPGARDKDAPPSRFLLGAALCVGLAVAANIKALFLAAPLLALSLWLGVGWRNVRLWQWAAMLPVAALPLAPMLAFALLDPSKGFSDQVRSRLDIMSAARLEKLAREPLNLGVYWTDIGAYGDAISGAPAGTNWPALALAWASLLYVTYKMVALLRARRGAGRHVVAAGAGALILVYIAVVVLLYDQQPEANYAPLHTIFGVATAATIVALGARLSVRAGRYAAAVTPGLVALVAALFGYNCVRRGDPSETLPLSINAAAQRSLGAYLRAHAAEGGTLVSTTYNLAGVLDSLGHGALRPLQAHRYLLRCPGQDEGATAACMTERWRVLLDEPSRRPLHVVAPASGSMIDEPAVRLLAPTLERAAGALGRAVVRERAFTTGRGTPVLVLYRVD